MPAPSSRVLRHRRLWLIIGHCLLVVLIVLSLIPDVPSAGVPLGDKMGHLLFYAVLMGWYGQLIPAQRDRALAALGLAALGVVLELLQGLGGARHMEAADAAANVLGIVLGWLLVGTPAGRIVGWLDRGLDRGRP